MTGEFYQQLVAINQFGAFYAAREGARHMRARAEAGDPGGSIVFCASLSALTGSVAMQHWEEHIGWFRYESTTELYNSCVARVGIWP